MILRYGEVRQLQHGLTEILLIRTACFVAFQICIVHLFWPLKKGMHPKVRNGEAVVQTSKVKLDGHCRHDFRHIPVVLKKLSFLNCVADQDKNHGRVWYYLRK